MNTKKGGWQANVGFFKDYVIKTPKTKSEMRKKISSWYKQIGKPEKVEEKIKKLQDDWKNSIKIIKSGKAPLRLFANPEFLPNGKIKQRRARMLSEEFEKLMSKNKLSEAKKLVDKVIDFILELWSYGIHEKTFKFYSEMGLLRGKIVLVDIGEITDDKEVVKKQLKKGHKKLEDLRFLYHDKVIDYYQQQIQKRLTLKKLNSIWESKKQHLS